MSRDTKREDIHKWNRPERPPEPMAYPRFVEAELVILDVSDDKSTFTVRVASDVPPYFVWNVHIIDLYNGSVILSYFGAAGTETFTLTIERAIEACVQVLFD